MTESTMTRTGWTGWVVFAGVALIVAGALDVLYGLIAVIGPNSVYFLTGGGELFLLNVAGWGWWHLISGATLILVGLFVLQGATWARVTAIVLVGLNALGQFLLFPAQPWWSLILLAVDGFVIYALTVHGRELSDSRAS